LKSQPLTSSRKKLLLGFSAQPTLRFFMIKFRYLFSLLSCVVLISLSACGFHLRSYNELPPAMHTLYLQTENPYGSFEASLRYNLRTSGVILVDAANKAPITLKISKPLQTNSNLATGPSSQARTYSISYEVTFSLANAQGENLLPPQTLNTSRNLILSANQLPQSNNQIDILNRDMEQDIINRLQNRLRSKQIIAALEAANKP
jgi:LPS-assembly lipoprotein